MTNAAIDLVPQLGNLGLVGEEMQFFTLQDTSPPRRKMTLWSLETGESWAFLEFRVPALIGTGRWTRNQAEAPQIKRSEYPCFLAPDSAIRENLDELGITVRCNSKHPSKFAMEQVASKKHPNSWKAWQAHLNEKDRKRYEEQQARQVEAMLELARNSGGGPAVARTTPNTELPYDANGVSAPLCEKCGGVIEGRDSFAKARHNKTCPAKDGA